MGPGPKSQVEVAKHTIRNLGADVCAKQTWELFDETIWHQLIHSAGLIDRTSITANVLAMSFLMWMRSLQDCRDPKEEMNSEPGMRKARCSPSSLNQIWLRSASSNNLQRTVAKAQLNLDSFDRNLSIPFWFFWSLSFLSLPLFELFQGPSIELPSPPMTPSNAIRQHSS